MKTKSNKNKPLDWHVAPLLKAKAYYGKDWRNKLDIAWMYGRYGGIDPETASTLQSIRNDPNRKWNVDEVEV